MGARSGEKPPEVSRPLRTVGNVLLVVELGGGLTSVHLLMCHHPYALTDILYFQTLHH